jgi:hypothetical protein
MIHVLMYTMYVDQKKKERQEIEREKEREKERQRERGIFHKMRKGIFMRSNVRVVWIYFLDE